jgi:hypothetical protein
MLESNWKNVRNVLQRTRHVLPCLYVELFPKNKKDMPTGNLRKVVGEFDTLEDPTLQLKRSSVRRGAEATVALALPHGEEVDRDKVSSSHAQGPEEMKEFFIEVRKYSANLVLLILPVLESSIAAPSTSVSPTSDPTPAEVA